ncbi:Asp23/Gls24 family envelope stress response protein [Priestia megaterium]|nr:Asp23/Gls24 family envelope stress response protein [Priestia megaterium]MED3971943.1 Asp23/Gls24 family envelope stress response protein [Priestia megaterium]MED4796928.1 Asp23/Gls24 family envelope stress response protein [Priestia megaterium]
MTGLEVVEVNMHVEDVMTRSEFEAKTDRDKE